MEFADGLGFFGGGFKQTDALTLRTSGLGKNGRVSFGVRLLFIRIARSRNPVRIRDSTFPRRPIVGSPRKRSSHTEDDRDKKAQVREKQAGNPGGPLPSWRLPIFSCVRREACSVAASCCRVLFFVFSAAHRFVRGVVCVVFVGDCRFAFGFPDSRQAVPVERSIFHGFRGQAGHAAGVDEQPTGAIVLLELAGRDCHRRDDMASSCFHRWTDECSWACEDWRDVGDSGRSSRDAL
jgi:hypothetical protein